MIDFYTWLKFHIKKIIFWIIFLLKSIYEQSFFSHIHWATFTCKDENTKGYDIITMYTQSKQWSLKKKQARKQTNKPMLLSKPLSISFCGTELEYHPEYATLLQPFLIIWSIHFAPIKMQILLATEWSKFTLKKCITNWQSLLRSIILKP